MLNNADTLRLTAERTPDALAVADGTKYRTYGELLVDARAFANGLAAHGGGPGQRLLVASQNGLETIIAYWGCQLSGVVFTPVNWRSNSSELDYYLADSGATMVLVDASAGQAIADTRRISELCCISIDPVAVESHGFDELLDYVGLWDPVTSTPDDISVLFYTSGTTGPGKGVPRSHRAERSAAVAHVAQNSYMNAEITLGVMPLYHTMGVRSLLAMTLVGGTFVSMPRFDPEAALALLERHRVSALYLVPTLYHDLMSHSGFATSDLSSVRNLGTAGASMTDDLLAKLQHAFTPNLFVNHYGSSEIYTFTVEQNAARKPGSAGKAGLNSLVRVIPMDGRVTDQDVPVGQEGHVIASMANDEAFGGYWNRPDADAKALVGEWYLTGDVGYFDSDGDLFVTGRIDDMMIVGGENVLPVEIESILSLHPAVGEVAVVGLPDDRWGQRITAYIRRSGDVGEEDLEDWCLRSGLAAFKRPRAFVFIAEVPKSPVGKLLRRSLVTGEYRLEPELEFSS